MSGLKKQILKLYNPAGDANYQLQLSATECVETYPTPLEITAPSLKLTSGASVVTNVASSILANAAAVVTEQSARAAADSALGLLITAEETARINADGIASSARSTIQASLNAEIVRAGLAEDVNTAAITAETSARLAADAALTARIDGEVSSSITAETSARIAADNLEIVARSAADAVIQAQVDTEKSRIDSIMLLSSDSLNSFNEIVAAYNGADANLLALINNVTADIAQLRADFEAHFANA